LKTNNFTAAAKLLRERGLIIAMAEERFITLADGHSTADVTQALVSAGIAVEGVWQHEQTVEDFYMSLIRPPAAKN